jgi:hypothetical protein
MDEQPSFLPNIPFGTTIMVFIYHYRINKMNFELYRISGFFTGYTFTLNKNSFWRVNFSAKMLTFTLLFLTQALTAFGSNFPTASSSAKPTSGTISCSQVSTTSAIDLVGKVNNV